MHIVVLEEVGLSEEKFNSWLEIDIKFTAHIIAFGECVT